MAPFFNRMAPFFMLQIVHEHLRAVAHGLGHAECAALVDRGERVRQLVASVPPAVWQKVSGKVATHYHNLEGRYGRPAAIAIVSAGIVGTAVPLPGTTLVAAAPLIAVAELHHQLIGASGIGASPLVAKIHLAETDVLHLGMQWMQDLTGVLKAE
jgi:hypothetical protein